MQDDTDEDGDLWSALRRSRLFPRKILSFLATDNVALDAAADARNLSLWWWDADSWLDDDVEDSEDSVLSPGYGALAAELAADVDVTYGARVDAVEDAGDVVRVHLSSLGGPVTFDKVVVALPLGVLQSDRVTFSPPLSAPVSDALRGRGSGVAEKYVLIFEEPFWPDTDFLYTVEPDPLEWLNLQRALGTRAAPGPPGLACFAAGALALRLAKEGDIEAYLVAVLERMFPDASVAVVAFAASEWRDDEFALGAWSYVKPGTAYPKSHAALNAALMNGKAALAGEYVSNYFGTVHGAWFSGQSAADLVLDGPPKAHETHRRSNARLLALSIAAALLLLAVAVALAAARAWSNRRRREPAADVNEQECIIQSVATV